MGSKMSSLCVLLDCEEEYPRESKPENSYKGSSGIFSPVILQTEESFIPTTSSQQNLTDKNTD